MFIVDFYPMAWKLTSSAPSLIVIVQSTDYSTVYSVEYMMLYVVVAMLYVVRGTRVRGDLHK
jgi:hypothetical protein